MLENKLIYRKIEEIGETLKNEYIKERQIGVHSGLAGIALFYLHSSNTINKNSYQKMGIKILEKIIEMINNGYNFPSYSNGIAGFGWVLDYIEQEGFVDINCDELLSKFDNYLYEMMCIDMRNGKYDFLHGGIGYAYYFLKRYSVTKSKILRKNYKEILLEFLDLLNELSIPEGKDKLKWLSKMSHNDLEVFNLSLSHGMASIIRILTKIGEYIVFQDKSDFQLRSAINYVTSFINENSKTNYSFPKYIGKDGSISYHGRLAWCYSDLGIATSLWYASKKLKDAKLAITSIEILNRLTGLKSPENHFVVDAGICHGSFGIAHMFRKMNIESNKNKFNIAAEYWFEDGLKKAYHQDGLAGFKQWNSEAKKWSNKASLLEGISGIGLTLVDYLNKNESTLWDESLMLS